MVPHTGTILGPASTHEHDAVLLDVVALAGDVGGDDGAGGQLDTGRLSLARVGLLGSHDTDSQAHALEGRGAGVGQRRRHGVTGALALTASAEDLVQRRGAGGRRREGIAQVQRVLEDGGAGLGRGRGGKEGAPRGGGEELAED